MMRVKRGVGFILLLAMVIACACGAAAQGEYSAYDADGVEWAYVSYPFAIDKDGNLVVIGDIPGILETGGNAIMLMSMNGVAPVAPQDNGETKWKWINPPFLIDMDDTLYAIARIPSLLQADGTLAWEGSPTSPLRIAENVRYASGNGTCAYYIDNNNNLYGWGSGCGDGTSMQRETPVLIAEDVATLMDRHIQENYLKKTDGTIWAWYPARYGPHPLYLDGSVTEEGVWAPEQVDSVYEYHKTNAYAFQTLEHIAYMLLDSDGTLYKYAAPDYNYLGERSGYTQHNITDPDIVVEPYMAGVADVITSGYTTFILKKDGTLLGWGQNDCCQLGDGTNLDHEEPIEIMGDVVDFVFNGSSSFALKADGSLWAWGDNDASAIGEGTDRSVIDSPVQIMTDVVSISVKSYSGGYAIKADGTLWEWGNMNRTPEQIHGD